MGLLDGKLGIVFGVANKRSIAWAIAQAWAREGARLAFTYQGQRVKKCGGTGRRLRRGHTPLVRCDQDEEIASVFSHSGWKFG